jgi:hypothetical protein
MAWKKDLIVIAGAETAAFEACRPLFNGFAKAAYHMGPVAPGRSPNSLLTWFWSATAWPSPKAWCSE